MMSENSLENKIQILREMISESENIVFFGGAGVSTESGIPDFRSVDGLYNQKYKYPPETIISRSFFDLNPVEFYDFYREKLIVKNIKPNITHKVLSNLEKIGKLKAIVTQNIDGLHQLAGSKNVLELHGSILRNYCMACNKFFDENYILESKNASSRLPLCDKCNSLVKPDVVLYEESLNQDILEKSINAIANADLLIVAGTSLAVYPAAGLINYFRGEKLVLINKTPTEKSLKTCLEIYAGLGEVFSKL